jgi:hypothetical protein
VTAVEPAIPVHRRRSWLWVLLMLAAVCVVAAISTFLTAPRPGGRMDPASTGPAGAHALVTLLRDRGVTVVVASSVADVENAMGPGTLLLFAQSQRVTSDSLLERLAATPGDLLVVEPTSRARAKLTPGIRNGGASVSSTAPNCALREANQAGTVDFGPANTYVENAGQAITSCYSGALVRYRDGDRTVTVVGSTEFMTNGGLLRAGNAALAMNLAGQRPRLVWYAPQHIEGESSSATSGQLDHPAAVSGSAADRRVEGAQDRPVGRREAAGSRPRIGDGRGSRPFVPVEAGTRSCGAGAARRDATATAAAARRGS